ncbi:MAG TPA: DUF2889 domain-containing protein [Methylomirabilota bacterium]|jgi:hypothetical protein|nr:DUF2889 domain-containing protein [Methylomirabilota bacterium]
MIQPALLEGRDRYERVMEAWVDNTHEDALTHTVRLSDDDRTLELSVEALPSPSYLIRAARCRPVSGAFDPEVAAGVTRLAGTHMVGGLSRRVTELTGAGDGAGFALGALVEAARLARQVAKLPRAEAERAAGDARACWQLDTTGWTDLANSCFTYTDAGRSLFGTRAVTTPIQADIYSPRPGQTRVFERRKVARLERRDGRLRLFHSMHDNVHGFEVIYEIDLANDRIVRAEHVTPRLPYMGICTEPQRKIGALLGETADSGLRQRIQTHLGGESGCAQLYDLTADLLKLLI